MVSRNTTNSCFVIYTSERDVSHYQQEVDLFGLHIPKKIPILFKVKHLFYQHHFIHSKEFVKVILYISP